MQAPADGILSDSGLSTYVRAAVKKNLTDAKYEAGVNELVFVENGSPSIDVPDGSTVPLVFTKTAAFNGDNCRCIGVSVTGVSTDEENVANRLITIVPFGTCVVNAKEKDQMYIGCHVHWEKTPGESSFAKLSATGNETNKIGICLDANSFEDNVQILYCPGR